MVNEMGKRRTGGLAYGPCVPSVERDCALLEIEMETLWRVDQRHRILGPLLAIGSAADGFVVRVGDTVPDDVAEALRDAVVADTPPADRSAQPSCVERCQEILGSDATLSSGPSYLVPGPLSFTSDADIIRSDDPRGTTLRDANPGNWEAREWEDLLAGRLGPWAMAIRDGQVISICHTPRDAPLDMADGTEVGTDAARDVASAGAFPRGVEAGTWTHSEFRGQGHAAATTAAWSELVTGEERYAFYSTSANNRSSQGVAARLGLPCIGWIWQFAKPDKP